MNSLPHRPIVRMGLALSPVSNHTPIAGISTACVQTLVCSLMSRMLVTSHGNTVTGCNHTTSAPDGNAASRLQTERAYAANVVERSRGLLVAVFDRIGRVPIEFVPITCSSP